MRIESKLSDLSRLCIHTITTKPLSIEAAVEKYAILGIRGVTVWRDAYEGLTPGEAGRLVTSSGMELVSLCRGGFFPSIEPGKQKMAIEDNLKAIEEASLMGAPLLVLVPGADPKQSLEKSRDQIKHGIETMLPLAEKLNIKLAIEPLHPVYADTRSAINTMKQANDLAEYFDSPFLGVAIDVYHVWWDPELPAEIKRCGLKNNIFAFHICDWKTPVTDILLDRGIMGEGCIDVSSISEMVNNAGFNGFNEVEIFSNIWWANDQDEYLERIIQAYKKYILKPES